MAGDRKYCSGCRDDFYNTPGNAMDGKQCWNLNDAAVVTRYRLHWWTEPTVPGAYVEVTTNSCHYEPGQFAFHKTLPDFVKPEDVIRASSERKGE